MSLNMSVQPGKAKLPFCPLKTQDKVADQQDKAADQYHLQFYIIQSYAPCVHKGLPLF